MISGTRPSQHATKQKRFERKFGGVIPDFNLDSLIWNPDQNLDNAPTECVGYTNADLLTDIFKVKFSPDFLYAAARWITRSGPGIDGASFVAGLQASVWVGGLLAKDATINATRDGELYVSDWKNWPQYAKAEASTHFQNGVLNVLGNGDHFTSIVSAAYTGKIGISLGSPWFKEWQGLPNGSVLPMPATPSQQALSAPWHNYACKGKKDNMLIIKAWTGGFYYMPQNVANAVFSVPGTGALTFNPKADRFISMVAILFQRGIIPGAAGALWDTIKQHGAA